MISRIDQYDRLTEEARRLMRKCDFDLDPMAVCQYVTRHGLAKFAAELDGISTADKAVRFNRLWG